MRDDQRRRAIVERPQGQLNDRLELLIRRAGGLVENQDTGAPEDRSRDRQALTLAAGQLDAAIADRRVVGVRQAIDELVGAGELGGRHDLAIGGGADAIRDVLADAAREQDRKSTRLNSSHLGISYAVFCLKKKNIKIAAN